MRLEETRSQILILEVAYNKNGEADEAGLSQPQDSKSDNLNQQITHRASGPNSTFLRPV